MTQIAFIHIALEIWGCIFCLIAALCSFLEKSLSSEENRIMMQIQVVNAILLGFDCLAWLFRGDVSTLGFYMVRISNCVVFLMTALLIGSITYYIKYFILMNHEEDKACTILFRIIYVICIVAMILVVVSQFTGLYYDFDEQNRYYRKDMYWLSMAIGISGMLLDTFIVIWKRKRLSRIQFIAFLSYIVLPVVAALVQSFIYGIQLLNLAITISVMIMFFTFQVERSKKYVIQERELHQAEIGIMMSQIQPHFLFNSLTTIKHLCKKDPVEAAKTIDEFSGFLRGSMEAVTRTTCIPFTKELDVVNNYLYLEQKRFGNQLEISYEIGVVDFQIPALSVQPIVENAVRHGVRGRIGGGCVTIATEEENDYYVVRISDDGVGFDPTVKKNDGKTHVGIENVKSRIHMMCNGQVEIVSEIGKGTVVRLMIPKNDK